MTENTTKSKTIQMPLTQGYYVSIDECDSDIMALKWHIHLTKKGHKYARRNATKDHPEYLMHRLILERKIERVLEKHEAVDHIDGNGLNNTRSNLRVASFSQNGQNKCMQKNNKTGAKGVTYCKGVVRKPYKARIYLNKRPIHLGFFATLEEAAKAYKEASIYYFGEFAFQGETNV